MRKVIEFRKSWPRFRNASSSKSNHASSFPALQTEQAPFVLDCSSYQRCPAGFVRKRFLGGLGNCPWLRHSNEQCSSLAQFSIATSRSYHSSIPSLQCLPLRPASTSSWEQSNSLKVDHAGAVTERRASLWKMRGESGNVEGYVLGKWSWTCVDRPILSDSEKVDESRPSVCATIEKDTGNAASRSWDWELAIHLNRLLEERADFTLENGIENGFRESFDSHIGSDASLLRTKAQMNWKERRPLFAETVRSLYLNRQQRGFKPQLSGFKLLNSITASPSMCSRLYSADATKNIVPKDVVDHSQRAVVVAIWCNFLVLSLKVGVWLMTSSHVMLAEAVHSAADLANQGLLAYGLISSRRSPDALHPYGYSRERFVWSLISAVGIFCLGCGATIVHGVQNLATAEPLANVTIAASVIAGSILMEGASLVVAYGSVKKGAAAEGMTLREYLWRGHDPTSVAVLMEDGAAVAGLAIAGMALAAAEITGNPMWDPIGSILVGNLLGVVAIFLIQRNRQALLGRSIDDVDMRRIINLLIADPVVEGLYDCKSEVIGPGEYRFKAEIDFNGVVIVQNYLQRAGRDTWMQEFRKAVNNPDGSVLDRVLAEYGEEVVSAVGCEVDRLEKSIQELVPGIRHVDIEAHNPNGPVPREKFYLSEKVS